VLVASPDGKSLFAANWASKSVTQIDIPTAEVVRTLNVGNAAACGMAMSKSGKLYVANFFGDSIDVFEGKDLDQTHRLSVCKCPRHLALSPEDVVDPGSPGRRKRRSAGQRIPRMRPATLLARCGRERPTCCSVARSRCSTSPRSLTPLWRAIARANAPDWL